MPNQDDLRTFGQQLRQLRQHAEMSQEALAYKAGIDRSYLGGIERGEHNLALLNILKIAQALQIKPSVLLQPLDNSSLPVTPISKEEI